MRNEAAMVVQESGVQTTGFVAADNVLLLTLLSIVSVSFTVVACICCYARSGDDSDSERSIDEEEGADEVDAGGDEATSDGNRLLQQQRSSSSTSQKKVISFPWLNERSVSVKSVQPDAFGQWSLNKSLGLSSRDSLTSFRASALSGGTLLGTRFAGGGGGGTTSASGTNTPSDAGSVPFDDSSSMTTPAPLGRINFHVAYDFDSKTLTLKLISASDLPAKDFSGTSDPYVKIMLLPDRKQKLLSNTKRKNLNPSWNETFVFEGYPYNKIQTKILYLQVLDYDRFSRNDPIGEVLLFLSDVDIAHGETLCKELQPCKGQAGKLGELLLSLCYQQTTDTVTVVIIRARDLKAKDINGLSDPYVKVWLMLDGKKIEKKKTKIHEKTLNPEFNEVMVFSVTYERIRQISLHITVMDYDRLGQNELIGCVILGNKSMGAELKHWKEMLTKPRQTIEKWHILKNFG